MGKGPAAFYVAGPFLLSLPARRPKIGGGRFTFTSPRGLNRRPGLPASQIALDQEVGHSLAEALLLRTQSSLFRKHSWSGGHRGHGVVRLLYSLRFAEESKTRTLEIRRSPPSGRPSGRPSGVIYTTRTVGRWMRRQRLHNLCLLPQPHCAHTTVQKGSLTV